MKATRRRFLSAAAGFAAAGNLKADAGLFHAVSLNSFVADGPGREEAGEYYAGLLGARIFRDMGERGRMLGLQRNYLALFQGDEPRPQPFFSRRGRPRRILSGRHPEAARATSRSSAPRISGLPVSTPTAFSTISPRRCAAKTRSPRRCAKTPTPIPSCMRST